MYMYVIQEYEHDTYTGEASHGTYSCIMHTTFIRSFTYNAVGDTVQCEV